jgi:hypothetical protein
MDIRVGCWAEQATKVSEKNQKLTTQWGEGKNVMGISQ